MSFTAQADLEGAPRGILPIAKSSWSMPGGGEAYSDCGSLRFRGCLNIKEHNHGLDGRPPHQAYVQAYKRSCNRRECPKCFESWAWLEGERAEDRLVHYRGWRRAIHVVFSCPTDTLETCNYEVLRLKMYKIAFKCGLKGGLVVFHPFRLNPRRWSPHFHVLGYGWIVNVEKTFQSSGWVIKNIGIRKTLKGTVKYQLSHCGIHASYHAITWFGRLAYNKMKLRRFEHAPPCCPWCGEDLRELIWIGGVKGFDRPPPIKVGEYADDRIFWEALPPKR